MTLSALNQLRKLVATSRACALVGVARSKVYRWESTLLGPVQARRLPVISWALSEAERARVLGLLDDERFADKAPAQVWAILLDEGVYVCSQSTMYRILRSQQQVRERRAVATHPPRSIPTLLAAGPDEVFSWDITKLAGPVRGVFYDAYVIIDIYSRKIIHWEVHPGENGPLARDFLDAAIRANGGVVPDFVHSDNGTSMTSKTVAAFLAGLEIHRSLSRPHVSNDNPYSESMFKTMKYCPVFPERFGSIQDARVFMAMFVEYYNHQHRHSGIGLYTPASVHDGSWKQIRKARQAVLDAAYRATPDRFRRGRPTAPAVAKQAWINQPPSTIETSTNSYTPEAA